MFIWLKDFFEAVEMMVGSTAGAMITLISVVVSMVTIIMLICTYVKDQKTEHYEFIADYNFCFLTSDEFQSVERLLESCYQKSKVFTGTKDEFKDECEKLFKCTKQDAESGEITIEYQKIVNYLVYLESFIPLIENKLIKLKDCDDLFGYRYFIAVNNPYIQETELLEDRDYYKATIRFYERWKRYREKRRIPVPLQQFDLTEKISEIKYQPRDAGVGIVHKR